MKIGKYHICICLFCILLVYLILQTYNLAKNPPGLFCDEASLGVEAYHILSSLRDTRGVFLPLFFKHLGRSYACGFAFYATIPSILIGGLAVFPLRFTAVWMGFLILLFSYFLGKELFKSPAIGVLNCFFLLLSPFFLNYSRNMLGYISVPFILTIVVFLFVKKKPVHYILAMLLSGIIFYTYAAVFLSFPFLFIALFLLYGLDLFSNNRKYFIIGIVMFLFTAGPAFYEVTLGGKGNRASEVSGKISAWQKEGTLLKNLTPVYFGHFSYDFLFKRGPAHLNLRNNVLDCGFYPKAFLPFIVIGLCSLFVYAFFRKRLWKEFLLIVVWLSVYPIGGVFTGCLSDNRSIIGMTVFPLIAAYGFWITWSGIATFINSRLNSPIPIGGAVMVLFLLAICYETGKFLIEYHTRYIVYAEYAWQWGAEQIIDCYNKIEREEGSNWQEYYLDNCAFNIPKIFLPFFAPSNRKIKIGNLTSCKDDKKQLFAFLTKHLSPAFEGMGIKAEIKSRSGARDFSIVSLPGFKNIPRRWLVKKASSSGDDVSLAEDNFETTSWGIHTTLLNGAMIDFPEVKAGKVDECYYFATYIRSAKNQNAQVRLGRAQNFKLWFNKRMLLEGKTGADPVYLLDSIIVPITLEDGYNQVIIKLCGEDIFTFRVTDDKGFNLQDIIFSTEQLALQPALSSAQADR